MTARSGPAGAAHGEWRRAIAAGVVYTLIVFAVAFVVGAVRVTLVVPRVGSLLAVILEAPIVLAGSWRVSRWGTRRFKLSRDGGTRAMIGAVAFSSLMLLELGVSVLVFGSTLESYFAKFATLPGVVGLAVQLSFAAIPRIQSARSPRQARVWLVGRRLHGRPASKRVALLPCIESSRRARAARSAPPPARG